MASTREDLEKVQSRAKSLSVQGGQYESASYGLEGQVMEAVRAARAQRGVSKLAEGVGATMGQIPTASAGIRQRAGDLVNPLEVDVLTASQRGQQLETLGTLAKQTEYESGTLTDIIGERSGQLKAMAASKLAEAQQAQYEAQSIMQQLQFDEDTRQFNESLTEKKRQFDLSLAQKGGGAGGGAGLDLGDDGNDRWLNSYVQNLSPELRASFIADLQTYADLGYEDDLMKTLLEADYGKERATPEQQEAMVNIAQPYKAPFFPTALGKVQDFLGLDPTRERQPRAGTKKRGR